MKLFNYKKTIIGLSIIFLLLVLSFLYPLYGPLDFNKTRYLYDQKGNVLGAAPFRPSSHNLLGSDRNGADILLMMIYGAKFTLLTALGVTIFRVVLGGIGGIILSIWLNRLLPYIKDFLAAFNIVPPIIITLFLMLPVSGYINQSHLFIVLLYQIMVLVIMGIPSVLLTTAEIIGKLKGETFVQISYLMGANHFHVVKTQLKPFLKSYGLLMMIQHLINTLVLMMFLGAFGIYIGGVSKEEVVGLDAPNSLTKEWAGLIGQNYGEFYRSPWIVLVPLISYFILIFIFNLIKKELEASMETNLLGFNSTKKKPKEMQQTDNNAPHTARFTMVKQHE